MGFFLTDAQFEALTSNKNKTGILSLKLAAPTHPSLNMEWAVFGRLKLQAQVEDFQYRSHLLTL